MIKKIGFLFLFIASNAFAQNANNPSRQSNDWKVTGNAGTNSNTDFIGTTDNIGLSFRTNNIIRQTISNNGNVGIGTTAPIAKLDVNGSGLFGVQKGVSDAGYSVGANILNATAPTKITNTAITTPETALRLFSAGTVAVKYNPSADVQIGTYAAGLNAQTKLNIRLGNNSTHTPDVDVMTLQGDGNVGIGTTAPIAKLDVTRGTAIDGTAVFRGTQWSSHFNYSVAEDTYIRGGKSTSNIYIGDIAGTVTIGATSSTTKLAVVAPNAAITVGNAGGSEGALFFGNSAHGVRRNYSGVGNDVGLYTNAADVHISAAGESSKHITVKNSGNVGINNTNALNKLHITGGLSNTTGIRTSITSASPATTETSYLAVNASGDIVKGAAVTGGSKAAWFDLSSSLSFGPVLCALPEYTAQVDGAGQVKLRQNCSTNTIKTYNIFQTNNTALSVASRDVSMPNASAFYNLSHDASGDKVLPNNTIYESTIAPFGNNRYILRITSFGGGYSIAAQLLTQ